MIDQVRPSQLATWLQAHRGADAGTLPIVLDVREPWEWKSASITADGFDLLCMAMGEIPTRLAELPSATPIACLCHHGARSQRVAAYLEQHGHGPMANIAGGIDAWSSEIDANVPRY